MFFSRIRLGEDYEQHQKELDLFMHHRAGSAGLGLMAVSGL